MHNSEMFIKKFQWSQFHSPERLYVEIMKEQGWKGAGIKVSRCNDYLENSKALTLQSTA